MPRGVSPYDEAKLQGRLWTPAVLSPLLWLDAADLSTITVTGSGVSEWRDKSGNNRHFTQSTDSLRPTLTVVNRLNAILYDGSNDALSRNVESWMYTYPLSFVAVFRANSFGAAYNGLAGFYSDSVGATSGWGALIKSNGKSAVYSTSTTGQPNYDGTGVVTYQTGTTSIFQADIANNIISSYGDGASDGSTSGTWTLRTNIGTGSVSIGSDARFNRYTNWSICESLIIPRMTIAQRDALTGFFAWKWGSTNAIPAGHPYRNRPPMVGD